MFCIRRKRKTDEEEWSAAAFKRQSAILVDDPEPQPPYNPRPPTMIERHNASPALAAQRSYQNYYGGYGQQAAYGSPENMHAGSPPPTQPHVQMAMGYAPHDDHSQLARQPSNATYLSRQPATAGYDDPQAHYVNLNRSSVTPFQAAQYADISRQLGGDVMSPSKPVDATPLPSPFDDEVEETYPTHDAAPRALSPAHVADSHAAASTASAHEPAPASRGREITNAKRPDTVYTMYDEGDAYDGI
ncbi:uncharacterized protein EDB91DRAFT_1238167 [Suillus paluster]|uniref:uncharacterized protein n=1 Tax=Suillus paluster TaxID=48578 RepID=UPI001B86D222|nr:uncharacterized protein EDB91DRAFT_1238167 [Suillus paluster]KAG1735939.1 hypothetical protein EDB91DRAFT_1238167 [Suillus paluster]